MGMEEDYSYLDEDEDDEEEELWDDEDWAEFFRQKLEEAKNSGGNSRYFVLVNAIKAFIRGGV